MTRSEICFMNRHIHSATLFFLFFFLHKIALLLTPTAYNSTSGPRVTKNTDRKSYFASQTKPSACYCDDRKCVKSPEFYAQYGDAALKLRPYGAIQIWLLLLLLLSACYP